MTMEIPNIQAQVISAPLSRNLLKRIANTLFSTIPIQKTGRAKKKKMIKVTE